MDIIQFPRAERDLIEATSISRPDTDWVYRDKRGHVHRWSPEGPYDPSKQYATPSLVWVKDGEEWWEDDDEPHDVGHLECAKCGETVKPGYKADENEVYVAGLLRLTDLEARLDLNVPDDKLLLATCLDFFRSQELMTIFGFVGYVTQVNIEPDAAFVSLRPSGRQE